MPATLELPQILDIPEKLLPMITDFNKFRYFVLEGGRGSGKSHAVARFILYLCSIKRLRVICAREIQNSIEESVYQLLADMIREFKLDFDITKAQITHRQTGSTIRFKGCREQGAVSLKSMEGIDILWLEEAQSITQATLDIIIPTIRKDNAKVFATMNRYIRTDPVFETLVGRDDCLHVHIDYFENKFCPDALKKEAQECKDRDESEYNHIWLGQPKKTTVEYMYDFDKIAASEHIESFGEPLKYQKIMGVDFASGGGDLCVASLIERTSHIHWELTQQIPWDEPDTDISTGKVISLFGQWQPEILVCDAGGLGYPIFVNLSKTIKQIIGFDGSKTNKCVNPNAGNNRYQAHDDLREWLNQGWLKLGSKYTRKELETIKRVYQRSGKLFLLDKQTQRKQGIKSQDRADSVAMAVYGAVHYLGKVDFTKQDKPIGMRVQRVNKRKTI